VSLHPRAGCPCNPIFQCTTLHAEEATTGATVGSRRIALHLLADLDVDVEELGNASVQADGLSLVELGLVVVVGNTLASAGPGETVEIQVSGLIGPRSPGRWIE
jgi:hypothetical protein